MRPEQVIGLAYVGVCSAALLVGYLTERHIARRYAQRYAGRISPPAIDTALGTPVCEREGHAYVTSEAAGTKGVGGTALASGPASQVKTRPFVVRRVRVGARAGMVTPGLVPVVCAPLLLEDWN